ncbi:MAG TPA: PQQ-binding-like beta-propeller repeat protein [Opitutus sp.]|nr:PQQ-binding-like beta-propeller repeat protein [Opitutus sp.]
MRIFQILPWLLALVLTKVTAQPAALPPPSPFEGVWIGRIVAPNTSTTLGLAFTRTEKGLLVSLYFPEMFLYGVNFGPAEIHGDTFSLAPLSLSLTLSGDNLAGTFAIAKLPVELHRGGTFDPAPPTPSFPRAPSPAWSRSLGAAAWASPVARDGVLYFGTVDGKFHAIKASDGDELWSWPGPNPFYGAALADEKNIFVVDEQCALVCLDRVTGALAWRSSLYNAKLAGGPPPKNETFNHRATAPVLDEKKGLLYVGSTDGGLYAVRARNGKILWRQPMPARIYAPVTLHDADVFVACFDGTLLGLDRRTRREILRAKPGGALVASPVVAGDRIVIGARDYMLYGLDTRSGATTWRDSYWFSWVESTPRLADGVLYVGASDFRRVSAIDPAAGRTLWATDVGGLSWGTPLVTADKVFAGTAGQNIEGTVIHHAGGIMALDRNTGAVKWHYRSPIAPKSDFVGFAGSLVEADGKIIGAAVDGTLIAFPIAP